MAILFSPYALLGDNAIVDPVEGESIPHNTSIATTGTADMGSSFVLVLHIDGSEYDRQSKTLPPMGMNWDYTWTKPMGGWTINDDNKLEMWKGQNLLDTHNFKIIQGA